MKEVDWSALEPVASLEAVTSVRIDADCSRSSSRVDVVEPEKSRPLRKVKHKLLSRASACSGRSESSPVLAAISVYRTCRVNARPLERLPLPSVFPSLSSTPNAQMPVPHDKDAR